MHHHLYFNQDCPVCHRGLRVPIEWFGTEIRCARCSGTGGRSFESRAGAPQAAEPGCGAGQRDSDSTA